MFKCSFCQKSIGPRVKPLNVVLASDIRSTSYVNEVRDPEAIENPFSTRRPKTVTKVSTGSEFVKEMLSCGECQGITPRRPLPVDDQPVVNIVKGMQAYARKSKHKLDEDVVMQKHIMVYGSIPLNVMSKALEDTMVKPFKNRLAYVVSENAVVRAAHANGVNVGGVVYKRKNKRALADCQAAFPLLKRYENAGGKF